MGQLDTLWVYQQYDKEIDKRELEFKHSENLQNALKLQKYLKTMQDKLHALDDKAQKEQERFERVGSELAEVTEALEEGKSVLKNGQELALNELSSMKKECAQMKARMKKGRDTIRRSMEQTQAILTQLKEIRGGMKKAKDEYDELRAVVETEQTACNEEIKKIQGGPEGQYQGHQQGTDEEIQQYPDHPPRRHRSGIGGPLRRMQYDAGGAGDPAGEGPDGCDRVRKLRPYPLCER